MFHQYQGSSGIHSPSHLAPLTPIFLSTSDKSATSPVLSVMLLELAVRNPSFTRKSIRWECTKSPFKMARQCHASALMDPMEHRQKTFLTTKSQFLSGLVSVSLLGPLSLRTYGTCEMDQ